LKYIKLKSFFNEEITLKQKLVLFILISVAITFIYPIAANASILDNVRNADLSQLRGQADEAGSGVLSFLRELGLIAAVVVLVWNGLVKVLFGGNERMMLSAKQKYAFIAIGLFVAFFGEGLIGGFLNLIGVEL
jgi:hypothetical protein